MRFSASPISFAARWPSDWVVSERGLRAISPQPSTSQSSARRSPRLIWAELGQGLHTGARRAYSETCERLPWEWWLLAIWGPRHLPAPGSFFHRRCRLKSPACSAPLATPWGRCVIRPSAIAVRISSSSGAVMMAASMARPPLPRTRRAFRSRHARGNCLCGAALDRRSRRELDADRARRRRRRTPRRARSKVFPERSGRIWRRHQYSSSEQHFARRLWQAEAALDRELDGCALGRIGRGDAEQVVYAHAVARRDAAGRRCGQGASTRHSGRTRLRSSFDHLVGAAEQRQRKGEAERLRGL